MPNDCSKCPNVFQSCRESQKLILVIVAIALFLDNMLLTVIVPIIPDYLYSIRHLHDTPVNETITSTITTFPIECSNSTNNYTCLFPTISTPKQQKQNELQSENIEVGLLFASKAIVQLITNPFVGPITNRIGFSIPMFCGFVIMFLSTVLFAFGRSYAVLCVARALQGIGSSCSSVSGMGILAERYPNNKERGNAMGLALGCMALGVMVGPPFGGVVYQFVGKSAPFLILATMALGDGILQLLVLNLTVQKQEQTGASLITLIRDPYIILCAGAVAVVNMGIAMLEPTLPIWMTNTMDAPEWQTGVAFLPASISYLIGTNLFSRIGYKIGRWLTAAIGLLISTVCLMCIPLATNIIHLIIPNAGLGFAIGMVDSSMMPELGNLVDIRHVAVYGSVYAIGDVAFCIGFAVGPMLSGSLVQLIGFGWMLVAIALVNVIYSPLLLFLKYSYTKIERQPLINDQNPVQHITYNNIEDPPTKY